MGVFQCRALRQYEKVSKNQRRGWQSLLTNWHVKHKLGKGNRVLASRQVL